MPKVKKPVIDLADDDFGCILNCAVRYAIGRQTYMPGLVIDFITPLLPYLSNKTVYVFDQDVTERKYFGTYGDERIDEPYWMRFLNAVREEEEKRGMDPYRRLEGSKWCFSLAHSQIFWMLTKMTCSVFGCIEEGTRRMNSNRHFLTRANLKMCMGLCAVSLSAFRLGTGDLCSAFYPASTKT